MSMNNPFNSISYIIIVLAIILSLSQFFIGINKYYSALKGERRFPWYNYPPILKGIAMFFMSIFYIFFVAELNFSQFPVKMMFVVLAFICAFIAAGVAIRASRYKALSPPKRTKRRDAQPKD